LYHAKRRRSLFSDLSVVLFDTTSLMFTGRGGESLGQRGVSKDHRPDRQQVVVGVVLDETGRPICSETWPGNEPTSNHCCRSLPGFAIASAYARCAWSLTAA
jgi:transposase